MGLAHLSTRRSEYKRTEQTVPLEHEVAGPDAALDAYRGERVELEAVAQHVEETRLLGLDVEVGCRHFERHGVSRLAQLLRQVAADQQQHVVEAAVCAQDLAAAFSGLDQGLLVEIAEDG